MSATLFILTRRVILGILAAILGLAALIALGVNGAFSGAEAFAQSVMPVVEEYELELSAAGRREIPVYSVGRNDKKIALTIDAAWGSDKTAGILEILEKKDVIATWFLCGFWIDKFPDEVKRISEAGHEIGNHTATHPHMTAISAEQARLEITEVEEKLIELTGIKPTLYRAPFGEYDDRTLVQARELGYTAIQWSASTEDWQEGRPAGQIISSVLKKIDSGGIILCHNNADTVLEYLPTLIDELKAQGYSFSTVSELLLKGDCEVDSGGVQRAK